MQQTKSESGALKFVLLQLKRRYKSDESSNFSIFGGERKERNVTLSCGGMRYDMLRVRTTNILNDI